MKKAFTLLTLVVMCAFVLVGCKKAEETAPAEAQTFTVGFDAEFPPYGFLGEDGNYKGFDLDLAREVCLRNGWTFVAKPIDWAAKDAELNAGTIDCIWNGFTITDERKDQYTWSSPYVQNKQLILVKKDSGLKAIADLNGKAVAAQDGSSGASALEDALKELQKKDANFNFKEYKKVKDYVTAKTMLESGAVDAVALDSAVALGFIEKSNGAFVTFEEPLMFESYGVGFKKGNTVLRDKVEATLHAMVKDGTIANILKHWKEAEAKNGGDGIDFILLP
ncbi:MAG: amino acid ABC transporter substrate-binding protein [Victivallales bacterium]|nr:amino acid ABC transporter substrate-binding protein [Victivallales bacterium]MBR5838951.1 amino acid ABC transporter substrate-binding protein [Victivallales bacterium]